MNIRFAAVVAACTATTALGSMLAASATASERAGIGVTGRAPTGVPGGRPPGSAPTGVPGGRPPGSAPTGRVPAPRRTPLVLAGYAWSTSTSGASIDSYYAFNSTGGAVTISNPRTGLYTVTFAGIGHLPKPTFDVTTYDTTATCQPIEAGVNLGNYAVLVYCTSLAGTASQALFDLIAGEPVAAPNGVLDYAFVLRRGALYSFQYNSSHKRNSVRHLGTGRYEVTMRGPRSTGVTGTVKVTANSLLGGDCTLLGWHGTSIGQVIDVDCFSPGGAPQNQNFFVTYVKGNNLMGLSGVTDASALANRPTDTHAYQPSVQFSSTKGARVSITRQSRGFYQVSLIGSGGPVGTNGGDVQVTTVGRADDHCRTNGWSQAATPVVEVVCVNNLGQPADSQFTIQWVVA